MNRELHHLTSCIMRRALKIHRRRYGEPNELAVNAAFDKFRADSLRIEDKARELLASGVSEARLLREALRHARIVLGESCLLTDEAIRTA